MQSKSDYLRELDLKHLWHPYTDMRSFGSKSFPIIDKADGIYLYPMEGQRLFDGIASWWCVNLGHSLPRLVDAIKKQAGQLQHCILGGISHPPVIELSAALGEILPEGINRLFYAGDGSCAVEAALKVAVQYWKNLGVPGKERFISLEEGYHGDTLGAVSVGYVPGFHKHFEPLLAKVHRAASPHCAACPCEKQPGFCDVECFASMEALIKENHEKSAAVIVEPLCQGAAGVRIYPSEYLRRLRGLCDKYGLLLIFDEIAVGFGRTGKMFAADDIVPDIMTLGKGLTNGYLPMSGMAASDKVYSAFLNGSRGDPTFYHGHTFTGNPITAALGVEVLKIYKEESVVEKTAAAAEVMRRGFAVLGETLEGSLALTLGMIGVVYINERAGGAHRARKIAGKALEAGLFVRPLGNSLYLWPPLVTTPRQLEEMFGILTEAVKG